MTHVGIRVATGEQDTSTTYVAAAGRNISTAEAKCRAAWSLECRALCRLRVNWRARQFTNEPGVTTRGVWKALVECTWLMRNGRSFSTKEQNWVFQKNTPLFSVCISPTQTQPFIFSNFSLEPDHLLSTITPYLLLRSHFQHRRNVHCIESYPLDRTVSRTGTDCVLEESRT